MKSEGVGPCQGDVPVDGFFWVGNVRFQRISTSSIRAVDSQDKPISQALALIPDATVTRIEDNQSSPVPGSLWRHKNGNTYKVLRVANPYTERPEEYPVTVVYEGMNGRVWSRPLSRWHGSMTYVSNCVEQIEQDNPGIAELGALMEDQVPTAWHVRDAEGRTLCILEKEPDPLFFNTGETITPLYTHPVARDSTLFNEWEFMYFSGIACDLITAVSPAVLVGGEIDEADRKIAEHCIRGMKGMIQKASLKPHHIREMVDELRDVAVKYHNHQSLRGRISKVIQGVLNRREK